MIRFISSLVGGLGLGGVYALVGLGLVLAWRATRTFNFAHGELMLLPAYLVGYGVARGYNIWAMIVISLVLSAVVGAAFYYAVVRKTTGGPLFMGIVGTFGLAAILDGVMGIAFKAGQYTIDIPGVPTGSLVLFGAHVSRQQFTLAIGTILLSIIVASVLRFSRLGVLVRAAGQNPLLASQTGVNVRRLYMLSWAVAALLAGVAGITYGSSGTANSTMIPLALAAIPAIVIGGLDSIEGALVGGIIIGLVQGFTQTYLGGQYTDLLTYGVMLTVMLALPAGLFGTPEVVRA